LGHVEGDELDPAFDAAGAARRILRILEESLMKPQRQKQRCPALRRILPFYPA